MAINSADKGVLRSWKEVASYLQCSVRTCRRWEETHGLPIHRIGAASKSSIFAYAIELDDWLRTQNPPKGSKGGRNRSGHRSRVTFTVLLLSAILLITLAATSLVSFRPKNEPADFRIDESVLTITDKSGHELWPFDTKRTDLAAEEYRRHFQTKRIGNQGPNLPYLIIRDLDGDGLKETLFSIQTEMEVGEGLLLCFDHKGTELWRYNCGREMTFGHKQYSGDYRIRGLDVFDLNNDGKLEVLVIGAHRPQWPCQVSLLNCRGEVIGEYWNSGYVADYAFADLNLDGKNELVLSGVHNEMKTGFLAVFDSSDIRGRSPQKTEDFTAVDVSPGSEIYYILIPRTDVDLSESLVETLEAVKVLENQRIQAFTACTGLFYEFGPDMQIIDINSSHKMEWLHQKLLDGGVISSKLSPSYFDDLKKRILYWTGLDWTTIPTACRPWR